jgi:hypothetical protein
MKRWLPNALGFQLVWMACVAGAANGWWWAGPVAVAIFAAWQLPLSRSRRGDALLMLAAAVFGFCIDTLWVQLDLMQFSSPLPWAGAAPVWIVSLWIGFALTLNHSLASLKAHLWMAALLGAIGGPLAYGIAEGAWSAVELTDPRWIALAALAIAWGLLTPALLIAAARLSPDSRLEIIESAS